MNEKCSHSIIRYYWSEPDEKGQTRGWWECESCNRHFAPIRDDEKSEAENEVIDNEPHS